MSEFEVEAKNDSSGPDSAACLAADEFDRRSDPRQLLEVGAVNAISESGPALVPTTAVKEIGMQAAKADCGEDELWPGDMRWMIRARSLLLGKGKGSGRFEDGFDSLRLCIDGGDFVEEDGFLPVEERIEEMLKARGIDDGPASDRQG